MEAAGRVFHPDGWLNPYAESAPHIKAKDPYVGSRLGGKLYAELRTLENRLRAQGKNGDELERAAWTQLFHTVGRTIAEQKTILRISVAGNIRPNDYSRLENADPNAEPTIPRKLRGTSILDYAKREIDESKNLLGNRWLSRQCGAFIVAPSGLGKSTLVIQASICWACGRAAFGIKPPRAIRILIIQAEDDDNDIIEMARMCDRLQLVSSEAMLVKTNTHVEWLNDVTGDQFFDVLADFLGQFPADLIVINPDTAYQGGELKDDKLNNHFLRVRLTEIMNRYNCGAIPIHHTPKTNFQNLDKYAWFDWMYSMAGGAALTNWARAILVIAPTDTPGTYRFIAAKRFEKIGWQDREYWFAHSVQDDKILWIPATHEQIAAANTIRRDSPDDLLTLIPAIDPILQEELWRKAKTDLHIGKNAARDLVNILINQGRVFVHAIPRENTKSAVGYAQSPPTNDES